MKKKIFSTLLIIIGLSIIAYPKASELYNDRKQQKIIQEWEEIEFNSEENYEKHEDKEEKEKSPKDQEKVQKTGLKKQENLKRNVEGILKIEKINLKLPVLSGATRENLRIALASIEHTGKPGQIGNYVVAGHRNLTYGRNFNRLNEVEIGDIIEMNVGEKKYIYTVVEKLYVKPEETWVLNGNGKDREITLITCHPMGNPTHRLIIKGKLSEN